MDKEYLEKRIKSVLREIYDPEIPVNIYELGLIYEINIEDDGKVQIVMTLTSPNCPEAETLPLMVKNWVEGISEVKYCDIKLTFEPTWDKDMMSEAAKLELGFL